MGFPRQGYWSGLPFPPPGDLPNPGIKLESPAMAGRFPTSEPPGKAQVKDILPQKESHLVQALWRPSQQDLEKTVIRL